MLEHVGCVYVPLFLSSRPIGNNIVLGVVGKEVQQDHSVRLEVEVESKSEVGILWRYGGVGDGQVDRSMTRDC